MAKTYTQNLLPLSNDWQLYNYTPSSRDEYRGIFTNNPLMPQGQHAGPSMDGLLPQYWGDILSANADMLRQRGYTGPLDFRVQSAQGRDGGGTQGDVQSLVDWMRGQNLTVGQSGPLKDGSARHGSYYTQLFDTSGGGYTPVGTGLQTENEYSADGKGILAVLLAAAGGAALNGGFGAAAAEGGGAAAGAGTLGATGATVPTLASSQIAQIAPVIGGMSPVAMTAPALAVGGAAAAGGGGAASAGGGGLLSGSADKAALFGDAGYGAGMSGNATSAFDTVAGLTGNNNLGAAAGNAADGNWLQAAQNVGSNMDWTDLAKLGLSIYGASQSKDQTQTVNRDPWGPAQPFILDALQQGQKLNQQYQAQPFSPAQQTAYQNLGSLLNSVNAGIPGLLSGMTANASGANNFDRRNPNRPVQGAQSTYTAWTPGLLDFFPKKGG